MQVQTRQYCHPAEFQENAGCNMTPQKKLLRVICQHYKRAFVCKKNGALPTILLFLLDYAFGVLKANLHCTTFACNCGMQLIAAYDCRKLLKHAFKRLQLFSCCIELS